MTNRPPENDAAKAATASPQTQEAERQTEERIGEREEAREEARNPPAAEESFDVPTTASLGGGPLGDLSEDDPEKKMRRARAKGEIERAAFEVSAKKSPDPFVSCAGFETAFFVEWRNFHRVAMFRDD